MSDESSVDELLTALYEALAATAERPVAREASAYVGEAEAVARDLAQRPAPEAVIAERVGHVRDLLAEVDETEDDAADEHVERAREVTAAILDRVEAD
ncbi:MAG: hypothetical protein ABEH80_06570 [Halobaculum sp.]